MSKRTSYQDWKKEKFGDTDQIKSGNLLHDILNYFYFFIYFLLIVSFLAVLYFGGETSTQSKTISLDKTNWNKDQLANINIMIASANKVQHPNPKRMVGILLNESDGVTVIDGDKGNGAFKKSYGISQVKLGSVYYVKNKRPDLIDKYLPEVNTLPKEDILHLVRKNKVFNTTIASLLHIVLLDVCGTEDRATVAYNRGVCTPDKLGNHYLNKVIKNELKI